MVTINNFTWRLGNQLYMIAAAYTLAQKNGVEFLCPEWKYQDYFKVKHKRYNGEPIQYFYSENGFHYSPIPFKNDMAISGYFQSEKYFDREQVKGLFEFEHTLSLEGCINHNLKSVREFKSSGFGEKGICSIHVRRGDYLNYPDHHPVCSLEYYSQAIKKAPINDFFVFSDDIEWCKRQAEFKNDGVRRFVFSEWTYCGKEGEKTLLPENYNAEIVDFQLMSLCQHNIIANSTFSWWAAMLNKNPDKVVISPSKYNWHGKAYSDWNHDDIIPSDWVQIKF